MNTKHIYVDTVLLTELQTHIVAPDGGRGLGGLHHLRQGPHLLEAGGHGLGVREALQTTTTA